MGPLRSLADKIEKEIQKYHSKAFVRLNLRSPKDSVVNTESMMQYLVAQISSSSLSSSSNELELAIEDTNFYISSLCRALEVKSGSFAVWLLGASSRVYQDLSRVRLHDQHDRVHLIIRGWCKEVDPLWEVPLVSFSFFDQSHFF